MQENPRISTPESARKMFVLALATIVAGVTVPTLPAAAEAPSTDEDTLLWAARACYVEASFREADCIALLWVTKKRAARAERPWLEMIRQYSAVDADTPRAVESRGFPWGDVPDKPDSWNRNWAKLRELVVGFANGEHRDPCPRAWHWGGTMDHPRGRMVRARCAVSTANTFYALKRRD